jgi:hypothetical protein
VRLHCLNVDKQFVPLQFVPLQGKQGLAYRELHKDVQNKELRHNGSSPSYVKEPPGRGTMGLFLSSVIILTLCVYTSIHLNIAPDSYMFRIPIHRLNPIPIFKKENNLKSASPMQTTKKNGFGIKRATVYKFYWVLIALVAPEFVLFAALNQWNEAKALLKALRNLDATEGSTPPDEIIPTDEVRESPVPLDENTHADESRQRLMPPDDDIPADDSRGALRYLAGKYP